MKNRVFSELPLQSIIGYRLATKTLPEVNEYLLSTPKQSGKYL